jgi:DNA-binding PadR family transcriptional regulator
MTEIHGDKLRGHLETLVLCVLEQGEAHGLEILERLEARGCGLLRLREGSLYPAIYRLEAARKIVAIREESQQGQRGGRRRIYRLTSKGKRELARGRTEWASFVRVIGSIVGAPA